MPREMDLLFAPREKVLEHFTPLLEQLEAYCQALEMIRDVYPGLSKLEIAVGLCREGLESSTTHTLELIATFTIASKLYQVVDREVRLALSAVVARES